MRSALVIALALGGSLLLAATAAAGQAERTTTPVFSIRGEPIGEEGTLRYQATAGAGTAITVRANASGVEISDSGGVDAGPGCTRVAPDRARCGVVAVARIDAGDGDDEVRVAGLRLAELAGGEGADLLEGATDASGGPGDDRLVAGGGGATLAGGPGADVFTGGPGEDLVSYGERTEGVRADLEGDADDGEAGEGDRVGLGIDGLVGGRGADVLVGDARSNRLLANGTGGDRVSGGGGDDAIAGAAADTLHGEAGDDRIQVTGAEGMTPALADGGPGDDVLSGTIYAEHLRGGPGQDSLNGVRGDDLLDAADSEADFVECARLRATARLDVLDFASERCGRIERARPARLLVLDAGRRTLRPSSSPARWTTGVRAAAVCA
jgi:Ca2+-binding RTX toxin-like protein